jgi:tRNA U34 5-carboxymethylaminomethyl modifying GTPase MnmE/TrmE
MMAQSHNVIIFGESGSGKSSIVNMIVGQRVAKVSSDPTGRLSKPERYEASIDDIRFNIYDTVGLNEGEQGHVPHRKAVHELYTLIRSLDGVSLLVYCMRGHITGNAQANWVSFNKVLCAEKVPIIAVETGLEREEDLDGRRAVTKNALKEQGMNAKDVACIISIRGKNNGDTARYTWSQSRLRNLVIRESQGRKPWRVDAQADKKFAQYYQSKYPDAR